MKNNLDEQYIELLKDILKNGVEKSTRSGKVLSVFSREIRHKMSDGFPLITTKKMYFKGIVTELIWFLTGNTNIKYLLENNCHIWDGDAYKFYVKSFFRGPLKENYVSSGYSFDDYYASIVDNQNILGWPQEGPISQEEFINKIKTDNDFAKKWGDLGPIYGKQWRNVKTNLIPDIEHFLSYDNKHAMHIRNLTELLDDKPIDQIAILINELKTNPDSRRLLVDAWNVDELDKMVLQPCHYGFQCYTRELTMDERYNLCAAQKGKMSAISEEDYVKYNIPTRELSLKWNQRSVDTPLGLPFNIASYGLLLEILAKISNMVPGELIGSLGDCHIYLNQIEGVNEQINRTSFELPILKHLKTTDFYVSLSVDQSLFSDLENTDFKLENYNSHPTIKIPLSN